MSKYRVTVQVESEDGKKIQPVIALETTDSVFAVQAALATARALADLSASDRDRGALSSFFWTLLEKPHEST